MKRLILISAFCILLAASCEKEQKRQNDNRFEIACESSFFRNDTLDMPISGGAADISVRTSETAVAWGLRTSLDRIWCDIVKYPESFTVSVPANDEGFRESSVTVVVGENSRIITVVQDYNRILACETDTVRVARAGGSYTVPFTTNIDASLISVTCSETWVDNLACPGAHFTFTAAENTGGVDRKADITVSAEGLSFKVVAFQPARDDEPQPNVLPEVEVKPVVNL